MAERQVWVVEALPKRNPNGNWLVLGVRCYRPDALRLAAEARVWRKQGPSEVRVVRYVPEGE